MSSTRPISALLFGDDAITTSPPPSLNNDDDDDSYPLRTTIDEVRETMDLPSELSRVGGDDPAKRRGGAAGGGGEGESTRDTPQLEIEKEAEERAGSLRFLLSHRLKALLEVLWSLSPNAPPSTTSAPHHVVPPEANLFLWQNVAIFWTYFLVGFLQGLSSVFLNVYPLDLGASAAAQVTIGTLSSLPASFKILFGFLSDSTPFFGYRRKSYMMLGWLINAAASASLYYIVVTEGRPTLPFLSLTTFLSGFGLWFADVMADSLVAEKARHEPPALRGSLQSSCYSARFFATLVGAPTGLVAYTYGPDKVLLIMALAPVFLVTLPLVRLRESKVSELYIPSPREQCQAIWEAVCRRSVWQPMSFVFLFNVLQTGNGAWRLFLRSKLNFTSVQLNTILVASYGLLFLGIETYKRLLWNWSWRSVYFLTVFAGFVLSLGQIALITGHTFGIPPFLFSMGDDCFAQFVAGIQFLPTCIMMVSLCPAGSEGAAYAMFTTVGNGAGTLSSMISTHLLSIWDVSEDAFDKGDYSGMLKLSWLTTALQMSGILFVGLLPKTREDVIALGKEGSRKSGGFVFLLVTGLTLCWNIVGSFLNIMYPAWEDHN